MSTGQPNITMIFRTLGTTAFRRSQKGVIAMILVDTKDTGEHTLTRVTDIPKNLGAKNKKYIERAFIGYQLAPKKIHLFVVDGTAKKLEDALVHFETIQFDYMVIPTEGKAEDTQTVANWIKSERGRYHMVKAVLPNTAADNEGVVNFTTEDVENADGTVYTTAEYCSRIAGILAGTPMQISATYAPLSEVTNVKRLSQEEMDKAADKGEFIIFHDGEKCKTGRAVNSFVTTTQDKGEAFRKIKIAETVDMITFDIRSTLQDSYIGKYANSYDNKCLLITALQGYFEGLELDGILGRGTSIVEIDIERQENYLKSHGIDTSSMSVQQIKEANTGSEVFLLIHISILDAIEDVTVVTLLI